MAKKGSLAGKKTGLFGDCKLPRIANRSFRVTLQQPTWKDELAELKRGAGSPLKKTIKPLHKPGPGIQRNLFE